MTAIDVNTAVLVLLRWIHVLAGIIWIGHLYFFNFVNVPFVKTLDADAKKKVVPQLMPRALFWFRWGAMITFLSGLTYIYWQMGVIGATGYFRTPIGQWILFGGGLGLVMWFNVWGIIWPAQKKIIAWTRAGESPPEMPRLARRAFLTSRTNAFLSGPMLFGMIGAHHLPKFNVSSVILALVFGMLVIWILIKLFSPIVGSKG